MRCRQALVGDTEAANGGAIAAHGGAVAALHCGLDATCIIHMQAWVNTLRAAVDGPAAQPAAAPALTPDLSVAPEVSRGEALSRT